MNVTVETTAQKLAQSLMQLNKALMLFNRADLHQHFAGCKRSEIGVLFVIRHATKSGARGMKVSEISNEMQVTAPTITQVLKGLEANGWIERRADPSDRRSVYIALTEKGEEFAQKAESVFRNSFQGLAEYLGEEESNQLAELLLKAFRYFNEREKSTHHFQWIGDEEA